jgi:uncharacterized membrane protein YphA (DoxX/SURF4 family)
LPEFVPLTENAMTFPVKSWPKELLWRFLCVYFFGYITTLSFDYYLLPNVTNWFGVPFQYAARFTGELFFGINLTGAHEFYSDSLLVYVHLFNVALIAAVAAIVWTWKARRPFSETKLQPWFFVMLRYFVAFNLFVYGFSKLYKWQFMLPEPNILYNTVGNTPRDLLYWTSMGTSHSYSVFMGLIEIIPGILLLFRRTTLAGAIISVLVMMNVVAVNLGFDITVKLHSFTLLFMSLVILIPARKRLLSFFTGKETPAWDFPAVTWKPKWKWLLPAMKGLVVLLLLGEAHYPYTTVQNFNDDRAVRPEFHGAYQVTSHEKYCAVSDSVICNETIPPDTFRIEKIFVHRRGYIIFQYSDGTMEDQDISKVLIERLNDSTLKFTRSGAIYFRSYTAEAMNWKALPLLEEEFTWIDEP